jgi:dTDP-4-dehydrorhamnose 3,5-epimerase
VLRGVHVHPIHDDYLIVLDGRATIGLRDLRRASPTQGTSDTVELTGDDLAALFIPHGVAHGFYFAVPSLYICAVSREWDVNDELGCRWSDPDLGIDWPGSAPVVSDRDADAPSLQDLLIQLEPWQPF